MIHRETGYDSGGSYVEWYDDEKDRITRWYGSQADCETLTKPPRGSPWHKLTEQADPFDLACERRYD